MKSVSELFKIQKETTDDSRHISERAKYINLTADLLDRPFLQVKILTKDWADFKIKNRYNDCKGNPKKWWGLRKWDMHTPPSTTTSQVVQ